MAKADFTNTTDYFNFANGIMSEACDAQALVAGVSSLVQSHNDSEYSTELCYAISLFPLLDEKLGRIHDLLDASSFSYTNKIKG